MARPPPSSGWRKLAGTAALILNDLAPGPGRQAVELAGLRRRLASERLGLRELIGDRLTALHRTPGGWQVHFAEPGGQEQVCGHPDPEEAYAAALLTIAGGRVE